MSVILNFFVNNYIWFLVISLVLIFALIGYFTDTSPDERFVQKVELDKELEERLAAAEASNLTLNQMVSNQSTKDETANVGEMPDKESSLNTEEKNKKDNKKDSSN